MLSNPVYDPFLILTKVYSDGAHLKQAIADTYIEEQFRSRTVKIVYGVLENDGYFDFCIKHYAPKAPKLAVRTILKISLYMLLFMDKKRYMESARCKAFAAFVRTSAFLPHENPPWSEHTKVHHPKWQSRDGEAR